MDAIARKRGTMTSDTTGVRDSVVNQLLAKMDGVKQASNVLVVGLTNRPELLDPALLRPGRLEVHLRIELPDLLGRRDILRIHTRRMRDAGALSAEAVAMVEDVTEQGLAARSEYFSGAEIAGLGKFPSQQANRRIPTLPSSLTHSLTFSLLPNQCALQLVSHLQGPWKTIKMVGSWAFLTWRRPCRRSSQRLENRTRY
jgi:hypothetical protein